MAKIKKGNGNLSRLITKSVVTLGLLGALGFTIVAPALQKASAEVKAEKPVKAEESQTQENSVPQEVENTSGEQKNDGTNGFSRAEYTDGLTKEQRLAKPCDQPPDCPEQKKYEEELKAQGKEDLLKDTDSGPTTGKVGNLPPKK